jgi:hypothetical protein
VPGSSTAQTCQILLPDRSGSDSGQTQFKTSFVGRLRSVAFILAKRRRAAQRKISLPVDLSRRPDLKDLYVKPHSSETYDELSQRNDDDDERD